MTGVGYLDDCAAGEMSTTGGDWSQEAHASRAKPARGILPARCTAIGRHRDAVPGLLVDHRPAAREASA
jgi:hypothetical protein